MDPGRRRDEDREGGLPAFTVPYRPFIHGGFARAGGTAYPNRMSLIGLIALANAIFILSLWSGAVGSIDRAARPYYYLMKTALLGAMLLGTILLAIFG